MKVAVIGGGLSGLIEAYLLEKEGINVTVYEKNEEIGGHCKTIVSKDTSFDIGTVCSFSRKIKELLIELQVDYTERFIYRSFVDENYHPVEHMLREDVILLMEELRLLKTLLNKYLPYINKVTYGYIPEELMMPLKSFLEVNNLRFITQVISPYLSSFGFGSIDDVAAYYVFKVFNLETIYDFIGGKKSLLIKGGTSALIKKLCENISHIKYGLEVISIEEEYGKVNVKTLYDTKLYDKVLISAPLPPGVIKQKTLNNFMEKLSTNSFLTCAFEVENKDIVTTYFKSHLGKKGKIQFLYATKHNNKAILTAYAYGSLESSLIEEISRDIKKLGIDDISLITVHPWSIFPHFKDDAITPTIYEEISPKETLSNITLIGSLISEPSMDNLYMSVKQSVKEILL